jgi:hypothetical protein
VTKPECFAGERGKSWITEKKHHLPSLNVGIDAGRHGTSKSFDWSFARLHFISKSFFIFTTWLQFWKILPLRSPHWHRSLEQSTTECGKILSNGVRKDTQQRSTERYDWRKTKRTVSCNIDPEEVWQMFRNDLANCWGFRKDFITSQIFADIFNNASATTFCTTKEWRSMPPFSILSFENGNALMKTFELMIQSALNKINVEQFKRRALW